MFGKEKNEFGILYIYIIIISGLDWDLYIIYIFYLYLDWIELDSVFYIYKSKINFIYIKYINIYLN